MFSKICKCELKPQAVLTNEELEARLLDWHCINCGTPVSDTETVFFQTENGFIFECPKCGGHEHFERSVEIV
jgi:uncharacterized Zn finger protein (UPF0148 family)